MNSARIAPAPRWTWGVTLSALACTLALFLAVPLLETLRNLQIAPQLQARALPLDSEAPPPPPPLPLPESAPREAAPPLPLPELALPAPPPALPLAPALAMPALFTPATWSVDPLHALPLAPSLPEVFDMGQVDQLPSPRGQLRPLYPPRARLHRIEGWVDLEFTVTAAGAVENLRVTAAHPDDTFVRAAVQAAERWSFNPGRHDNRAVPVRVRQRITFELQ